MAKAIRIEQLTDELWSLVGTGATPYKLTKIPILRELAGVPEEAGDLITESLVGKHLVSTIASMRGEFRLHWRQIDVTFTAEEGGWCYARLLKLEGQGEDADCRRNKVMKKLGVIYNVQTWRKRPERVFLGILAEHLYQTTTEDTPALV